MGTRSTSVPSTLQMEIVNMPDDCIRLIVHFIVTRGSFNSAVLCFPLLCKRFYNLDKKNLIETTSLECLKNLIYCPYNFLSKKSHSCYYRLCALTSRAPCLKCKRCYRINYRCFNCGSCPGCDMCQVCYGSCNKCNSGFCETLGGKLCSFCNDLQR